ncbi:FAD:protein FMN transferase [Litorihabitans aurantiacus]|uniref:FAD:protein FMN transferase n=1 Tax=Litorihabitans aurantiacus TaxID=1930061 RepID=A0AA37XGQ0_9MICO|nr:FAD:protein FMN transferase [Litorihabitans aurantiacus]GMA32676.1 FAD:protein FMN transferase [Litorihabitans aurantiacus]
MPDTATLAGRMQFEGIGTRWRIDTPQTLPLSVEARIHAVVAEFDYMWSRFRADSLVTALGREGGTIPVGHDGEAMLRLYSRLYAATDGAVNPLVGAALEHLGYDASYRLTPLPGAPAPVPTWEGIFQGTTALLTVRRGTVLDVGAVGKGRLVDLVADILIRAGQHTFTVDAGGDMRHAGRAAGDDDASQPLGPPLRVALEHPFDASRAVGVVGLRDAAIAASATNRRAWAEGLHHVIDARTGAPVADVTATWAIARTAMLADAASTAAFFLPPQEVLTALDGVHAVVVMPTRGPLRHAGLPQGPAPARGDGDGEELRTRPTAPLAYGEVFA